MRNGTKESRDFSARLAWHSLRWKNMAGDWRNEGRGVRGCAILTGSLVLWGSGVDGKSDFLGPPMPPGGVLAAGDAKEKDRAFSGDIRAGPSGDGLVGPTLDDAVSVSVRYQGLSESKWWDTVKEKREDEHGPTDRKSVV